ncbi:hypothetical protein DFS33DRAFT_1436886 [Desarmillaria ectypa]|nr:hypothetical protein DFS33DRAFT_1436886 [Desarmillaria ectypa]
MTVLYGNYAVCLARARTDDSEAKKALSRIVNELSLTASSTTTTYNVYNMIRGKVYIARVLRRLGETKQADEMETWLIKWFKKNPHKLTDRVIVEIFTTDIDQDTDPILKGLGEPVETAMRANLSETRPMCSMQTHLLLISVIEPLGDTDTDAQGLQVPRNAKKPTGPITKNHASTSRCWDLIKSPYISNFRELSAYLKKVAELSPTAPLEAQRASDWHVWRDAPQKAHTICFASGLGLPRDSSFSWAPTLFSNRSSVFPMPKMCLKAIMGLEPGEGKGFIEEVLDEFDHGPVNGLDGTDSNHLSDVFAIR